MQQFPFDDRAVLLDTVQSYILIIMKNVSLRCL